METQWVLELPKASNRFNFDTLVDVMLTIEYTALHSDRHAVNIGEALGHKDISLAPRLQYPDEWYHFKNDTLVDDDKRHINLELFPEFLPPHYQSVDTTFTKHITIIISGDFADFEQNQWNNLRDSIEIEHDYVDNNVQKTLQVAFQTKTINKENQYVFLSTRDSDDLSVVLGANISPLGIWDIAIKDTLQNNISLGDRITDVLLIVTTEGAVDWG